MKGNYFSFGAIPAKGGFIAYYRMVHRSDNFVLRSGQHDIIFATHHEAYKAAGDAFVAYLNSPISGMRFAAEEAMSKADALFNLPSTVKQRGKTKAVAVERKVSA